MANLLALDTSGETSSVALMVDGAVLHSEQMQPRQQAQLLLPQIEQLLVQAGITLQQLDALVYGQGPGSFTGLRIAAASVQGLALALDVPVIPVSTLQAIAWTAHQQFYARYILTLLDARMDEVYWAAWQWDETSQLPLLLGEEQLAAPEAVLPDLQDQDWLLAGSGACYARRLPPVVQGCLQQEISDIRPAALAMLHLAQPRYERGELLDAAQAQAVYLRNQVVHTAAPVA